MLYGYVEQNYAPNEPIFISDLVNSGLKIEKGSERGKKAY